MPRCGRDAAGKTLCSVTFEAWWKGANKVGKFMHRLRAKYSSSMMMPDTCGIVVGLWIDWRAERGTSSTSVRRHEFGKYSTARVRQGFDGTTTLARERETLFQLPGGSVLTRGSLIISIGRDTVYDVLVGTCGWEEVKVTGTVSMTNPYY